MKKQIIIYFLRKKLRSREELYSKFYISSIGHYFILTSWYLLSTDEWIYFFFFFYKCSDNFWLVQAFMQIYFP